MRRITYLAASVALSSRVPPPSGMVKYTMSRFNSNVCRRITSLAASVALSSEVPPPAGMAKYTMSRFNSNVCNL
jgi:hypothetical protein